MKILFNIFSFLFLMQVKEVSGQKTVILPIPLVNQIGTKLCWAACFEMISRYYDPAHPVTQCDQVSTKNCNCCNFRQTHILSEYYDTCNVRTGTDEDRTLDFKKYNYHADFETNITEVNIEQYWKCITKSIDSGYPALISIPYGDFSHSEVVFGYTEEASVKFLWILDPVYNSEKIIPISSFFTSYGHVKQFYFNIYPNSYLPPKRIYSSSNLHVEPTGMEPTSLENLTKFWVNYFLTEREIKDNLGLYLDPNNILLLTYKADNVEFPNADYYIVLLFDQAHPYDIKTVLEFYRLSGSSEYQFAGIGDRELRNTLEHFRLIDSTSRNIKLIKNVSQASYLLLKKGNHIDESLLIDSKNQIYFHGQKAIEYFDSFNQY